MGAVRVRACACVASKTEVTVSCDLASAVTPHPFFLFLIMAATSLGAAHTRGEMITRQSTYREGRIFESLHEQPPTVLHALLLSNEQDNLLLTLFPSSCFPQLGVPRTSDSNEATPFSGPSQPVSADRDDTDRLFLLFYLYMFQRCSSGTRSLDGLFLCYHALKFFFCIIWSFQWDPE